MGSEGWPLGDGCPCALGALGESETVGEACGCGEYTGVTFSSQLGPRLVAWGPSRVASPPGP